MEIVHKVSAEVMCAYNPRSKKLWRGEEKIVNQVQSRRIWFLELVKYKGETEECSDITGVEYPRQCGI